MKFDLGHPADQSPASLASQRLRRAPRPKPVFSFPWAFTGLLAIFLVCTTVSESLENPGLLRVGYVCVGMLGLVVMLGVARCGLRLPPELFVYAGFVFWAATTGLLCYSEAETFFRGIIRITQVGILLALVATSSMWSRSALPGFAGVVVLAVVLVGYGLLSGNFQLASEVREAHSRLIGTRATSLTTNANTLGMTCFWSIVGLSFFWRARGSKLLRTFSIALVLPLLFGITVSASRKAFLIVFVFMLAWLWFCYRKFLLRNLSALVVIGIVAGGGVLFARTALEGTMLGYRLGVASNVGDQDTSTVTRLGFYEQGLSMLKARPITGVGLAQFAAHSDIGLYSHSEYLEVFCNTGLVGGLLYFSMYIMAWRRLRFVQRFAIDPVLSYDAGVCRAALVAYAAVSVVIVQYMSFALMVLQGAIIGFAYGAEQYVRTRQRRPVRMPRPVLAPEGPAP